jgi:hypothetical protein
MKNRNVGMEWIFNLCHDDSLFLTFFASAFKIISQAEYLSLLTSAFKIISQAEYHLSLLTFPSLANATEAFSK